MDAGLRDVKTRALRMQKNTKEAERLLQGIRQAMPECVESEVFHCLQQCICLKYDIQMQKETDLIKFPLLFRP